MSLVEYTKEFTSQDVSLIKSMSREAEKIFNKIIKSTEYRNLSKKVALYNQEVSKLGDNGAEEYELSDYFAIDWLTVILIPNFQEHEILMGGNSFTIAVIGEQGIYICYDLSIKSIVTITDIGTSKHNSIASAVKEGLKVRFNENMEFSPIIVKEAINVYNKYFK